MHRPLLSPTSVVAIGSRTLEPSIRWHVRVLTESENSRIHFVPWDGVDAAGPRILAAVRTLARSHELGMIVSEWGSDPAQVQETLQLGSELRVPTLLVRDRLRRCRRVVVATAGGPQGADLLWMARQLARTFHAPVRLLRLVPAGAAPPPSRPNAAPSIEGVVSRVLGLQADIRTLPADDPAEALARDAAPGDILLLGAPSPLRITAGFSGSIPERVGARIPSSLVLLHRPASAPTDLRRILWGRLAQPRQRAASPRDAIASLVENLARHHQLPSSCTTDFVRRALLREQEMTTGVGGSTAFPHVRLRSFSGVAASFGVFPEGVDFQAVDGNPCNFLCFLVSSHGYSNEYLSILARFARRMLLPDVREALLRCATSEAIMDILEPQIVLPSIPATLSLKGAAP